jgi:two-component system sensor histidine kinase SenX3
MDVVVPPPAELGRRGTHGRTLAARTIDVVLAVAIALGVVAVLLGAAAVVLLARRPVKSAQPARPRPVYSAAQPFSSLVVEALDQGVIVLDADDRVVLLNPAARAMNVVDIDRLSFPDLTELADRARSTSTHQSRIVDLPIGRLGREPIALAVDAVPLVVEDRRVGAVGLLLADMSEQRRLESVRRDFVANVSHELKTPVGALTLLAEAVQEAADDPEAVARFSARMQHESTRLARLVQELMELSRVQGADPMPGAAEVRIPKLLTEACDRVRLAAEQRAITIEVRCPSSDLVVRGNEGQLITAISNLVDNAVAYSPSETKVLVAAVAGSDQQARPTVDISVTDQGLGIAAGDLDRIFERFYRVDPARSRATGGTGLGLAIVRNIVTNHLGTIAVQSTVDEGSTFTIRLPRVHSDTASSGPRRTADVPAASTSGARAVQTPARAGEGRA